MLRSLVGSEMCIRDRARSSHDRQLLDTDQDGVVDLQEFTRGGGKSADFGRYDRDESGALDGTELEIMAAAKGKVKQDLENLDANRDGVVSREEWARAGRDGKDFDMYDFNANGVLDADELEYMAATKLTVARAVGDDQLTSEDAEFVEASRAKARQEIIRMDADANGEVDRAEFQASGRKGHTNQQFDLYDVDSSEALTREEMELMVETQARARILQTELDQNKDGVVDRDEFGSSLTFEVYDEDGSGALDKDEVELMVAVQQISKNQMKEMDSNRDGELSRQEWREHGEDANEFDAYDLNHDGKLDCRELELRNAAKAKVRQLRSRIDSNKDGFVDRDEATAAGLSIDEFERSDLNLDGVLDQRELELMQATKDRAKIGMARLDLDRNGFVDKTEFEKAGGDDETFDQFDADHNGKLDRAEFEAFMAHAIATKSGHTAMSDPQGHDSGGYPPDQSGDLYLADLSGFCGPSPTHRGEKRGEVRRCTTLPRREVRAGTWNSSTNAASRSPSLGKSQLGLPRSNQFGSPTPRPQPGQNPRRSGPSRGYTGFRRQGSPSKFTTHRSERYDRLEAEAD
eukprot:TRINITY_DN43766_c0_g1_i1.p1 TRINITY_DN43766_c0_g1~~TRINITY_DN43766_c0_g1_i1.p1  ORF type:complete len:575 (+),score=152.91 TRINITY_DN43766_c0_g1_i1:113-1837(+)